MKKVNKISFVAIFLCCLMLFSTRAMAAGGTPDQLHESGWTIGGSFPGEHSQTYAGPQVYQPPQPMPRPVDPSVNEAWHQVWNPIEDISGIPSSSVRTVVQNSKQRFLDDTGEMISHARAWGVIIGDLGLGSTARQAARDVFTFTTTEVPLKLAQ